MRAPEIGQNDHYNEMTPLPKCLEYFGPKAPEFLLRNKKNIESKKKKS